MDLKDRIRLSTKINKTQSVSSNVKWSSVPKDKIRQYCKKPLPHHMELQKNLYDNSSKNRTKGKRNQNTHDEKEEEFQVIEIRQSIREGGLGWNVEKGVEKRYKESQKKYAKATADRSSSDSNASFTTARTSTTSVTDDSFSSIIQDFQQLQMSNQKKDENTKIKVSKISNQDKERYKRNALITGIIQNENVSDSLGVTQCDKENWNKYENKRSMFENRMSQFLQRKKKTAKFGQSLKDSNQKDSKKKDPLVQKNGTKDNRNYFMGIPDKRFCEFVRKA